jgi:hypothetical protein
MQVSSCPVEVLGKGLGKFWNSSVTVGTESSMMTNVPSLSVIALSAARWAVTCQR